MNEKIRLTLFLLALMTWGCPGAAPHWIAQASIPGPNTPETGQSRFDQLFLLEHNHYRIPYPFSRLVEFLDSRIQNSGHSGVRQVLVPSGRSLQRDAPAPDYFSFPRRVITLEGEPVTAGDQPQARIQQCAPRILARLKAWQAEASFPGSPMPPPASIAISGTTSADWPHSDHYRTLVASIEKLVAVSWSDGDYSALPACLSASDE